RLTRPCGDACRVRAMAVRVVRAPLARKVNVREHARVRGEVLLREESRAERPRRVAPLVARELRGVGRADAAVEYGDADVVSAAAVGERVVADGQDFARAGGDFVVAC